jgi:hypothetical protein
MLQFYSQTCGGDARITIELGGQVFHIAGDGMMAGFAVRDPGRSGARAALTAGRAMLQSFAPVAIDWRNEFEVVTGIGIGLHLGEVNCWMCGVCRHQRGGRTENSPRRSIGRT